MTPFIHPLSEVRSSRIGLGTRIWQYCVVLEEAVIGDDCNICAHCFIENDVIVGDRVTIKCGVQLWDGIRIEDDAFIGPNVSFSNDPYPKSRQHPKEYAKTFVKKGASIGAGATLLPGITIGANALVGAGSVVTSDVPPSSVVVGNPARIVRYVDALQQSDLRSISPIGVTTETMVGGAQWISFRNIRDVRGQLTVVQWNEHLPFRPERVFFIHHVPNSKVRGGHAHRQCIQILVALTGCARVVVDDGGMRQEHLLNRSDKALLIPAGLWATQYDYTRDCVLAVFASHGYDESDYIRDYDEFLEYCQK